MKYWVSSCQIEIYKPPSLTSSGVGRRGHPPTCHHPKPLHSPPSIMSPITATSLNVRDLGIASKLTAQLTKSCANTMSIMTPFTNQQDGRNYVSRRVAEIHVELTPRHRSSFLAAFRSVWSTAILPTFAWISTMIQSSACSRVRASISFRWR